MFRMGFCLGPLRRRSHDHVRRIVSAAVVPRIIPARAVVDAALDGGASGVGTLAAGEPGREQQNGGGEAEFENVRRPERQSEALPRRLEMAGLIRAPAQSDCVFESPLRSTGRKAGITGSGKRP